MRIPKVRLQTRLQLAQRGGRGGECEGWGINTKRSAVICGYQQPAISTRDLRMARPPNSHFDHRQSSGKEESKPAISIAGIGAGRRVRVKRW